MPRKRTSIADLILTYFAEAPIAEAKLTAEFIGATLRRREPITLVKPPKKRMARMPLKPAASSAPAPQAAGPAAAAPPPPPPPPGRRPRALTTTAAGSAAPGDPGTVSTVGD